MTGFNKLFCTADIIYQFRFPNILLKHNRSVKLKDLPFHVQSKNYSSTVRILIFSPLFWKPRMWILSFKPLFFNFNCFEFLQSPLPSLSFFIIVCQGFCTTGILQNTVSFTKHFFIPDFQPFFPNFHFVRICLWTNHFQEQLMGCIHLSFQIPSKYKVILFYSWIINRKIPRMKICTFQSNNLPVDFLLFA